MHPIIRAARIADAARLHEIELAAFPGDRMSARSFRRFIAKTPPAVLVAETGGRISGCAVLVFRKGSRRARLYSLAVAPEHQGNSLGGKLLDAAERHAAAHNCDTISLEVRADNGAVGMYRRRGYRERGRHPAYYQDGMDALRFEKPLSQ